MGESTLDERRACQIPNNRTILTVTGDLAEGQAHGRCLFCSNLISCDCHLPETQGHKTLDSYEQQRAAAPPGSCCPAGSL